MIEIDGIKYAESAAEMVDSLFNNGDGTLEMLPAVFKKALKKAAAEYKTPAETQKKLDYLAAIDGVFTHKIKIL